MYKHMKKSKKYLIVLCALIMMISPLCVAFAGDENPPEKNPEEVIAIQEPLGEESEEDSAENPQEDPAESSAEGSEENPAEDPSEECSREVHIEYEILSEGPLTYGSVVRFYASLIGFKNEEEAFFQWQYSADGETWSDVDKGTEQELIITIDVSNARMFWRVVVTGK